MVKGSCSCGQVTYEFSGEPKNVVICHCLPCRKASGAQGSFNLFIPDDQFTPSGEVAKFNRSGMSGKSITNNVCSKCYNLIYVNPEAMQGMTIVKGGTVDDEKLFAAYKPQAEIFTKDRAAWCTPMCDVQKEVM